MIFRKRRGFASPVFLATGEVGPQSLTVADFNRDGKPDIATGNVGDSVSVIENAGDRNFLGAVSFPAGDEVQDIVAAKLDGDRKPDLATANNISDSVSVLINDL